MIYFEVLSQTLSGGTEEHHLNLRISFLLAYYRTWDLLNANMKSQPQRSV
jgi:hypothetical protein